MIEKVKHGVIFAVSCLLALCISCKRQAVQWTGTITTEDGVTTIRNPKEPLYKEGVIELKEELAISGGQGEQTFMNLVSIATDQKGQIYILDGRAANIKVFDESGAFLKIIGQRGQGPGEFSGPDRLAITAQNEIMVSDPGRRLIQFLDLEGTYLRQLPQNMPFFSGPKILSTGEIVASYAVLGEEYKFVLGRFDSELKPISTYATIPMYKLPRVHIFLYRFVNDLQWDVTDKDEVIWGALTDPNYELNIYGRNGKLIRRVLKEYDPIAITTDEYQRMTKKWFGQPPSSTKFEFIIPKEYPPFHTFLVDDEGRIFVRRFEEAERGDRLYCEVFDTQGRYLTDFVFPENMIPALFHDGKLYAREEDEEGYQIIKRYKINWKF